MREHALRLNWGCGPVQPAEWHNSDRFDWGQINGQGGGHVGDIMTGLPWPDRHFDYIVTNHALQMVPYHDLPQALGELRRVLKHDGWLRILVPDLERAIEAYVYDGVPAYDLIADETEPTDGGKLCAYVTWYSEARSVFVAEYLESLLHRAGFSAAIRMSPGVTMCPDPECAALDSRPRESLIMEAQR